MYTLYTTIRDHEAMTIRNGLVSVKIMFVLKLPPFFPHQHSKGKRAAISKLACVPQKRIRSYNVLALAGRRSARLLQTLL